MHHLHSTNVHRLVNIIIDSVQRRIAGAGLALVGRQYFLRTEIAATGLLQRFATDCREVAYLGG
jgi:hypothetical protein